TTNALNLSVASLSKDEIKNSDNEKLYANLDSSYVSIELRIAVTRSGQRETATTGYGDQGYVTISECLPASAWLRQAVWVGDSWRWRHGRYVHIKPHYVKPRRAMVWVDGHWKNTSRGFVG
ncbi:MAG TPA: hypothetical protein VIU12_07610, partial [Chryseolinea sp.]